MSPKIPNNQRLIQRYDQRPPRQREIIDGLARYGSMTRKQVARSSSYARIAKDRETIAGRNLHDLLDCEIVMRPRINPGGLIHEQSYFELTGLGRSMYRAVKGKPCPGASCFRNEAKMHQFLATVEVATLLEEQGEAFEVHQWDGYGSVKYHFDVDGTRSWIEPDARCLLAIESGEIRQFLLEVVQAGRDYEEIKTKAYGYCKYCWSQDYVKDLGTAAFPPVLWVAESLAVKNLVYEKIVAGLGLAGLTPMEAGDRLVFALAQMPKLLSDDGRPGAWHCVFQFRRDTPFLDLYDFVTYPRWSRRSGYLFR